MFFKLIILLIPSLYCDQYGFFQIFNLTYYLFHKCNSYFNIFEPNPKHSMGLGYKLSSMLTYIPYKLIVFLRAPLIMAHTVLQV